MRLPHLLLSCTLLATPALAKSRSVAITIDDLPCANCRPSGNTAPSTLFDTNRRLVDTLHQAGIPATGFVITETLRNAGPAGQHALQLWLDSGFDLGNHTDTHPNFAEISLDQMEADTLKADQMLRPLLLRNHRTLQFFRFPYNNTGDTPAKHQAFAAFLADHHYRIATCTIDNSDFLFAQAYARALGAHDARTAHRIRAAYLVYTAIEIDFYAALNRRVLGYEPPQVMLLHDSLLNADTLPAILALFRARSYGFVSLATAQSDPAYSTPDTYKSAFGPMWGYRWAKERNLSPLHLAETDPPAWIVAYAESVTASTRGHASLK